MYPIRIRVGNANNGRDGQYINSTVEEAVAALRGDHKDTAYHRGQYVYVVATHAETHTEELRGGNTVERQAGEPLFGHQVSIEPQDFGFRAPRAAQINWPSIGASSVEETRLFAELLSLAAQIAHEANAVQCAQCEADADR